MNIKKEFPKECDFVDKVIERLKTKGDEIEYEGYWIDIVQNRLNFLNKKRKTIGIYEFKEIGNYKWKIVLSGWEERKVKIKFNRNSGMLEKFAELIRASGLNHDFIAGGIDMNVSTFRVNLYGNSFKIRDVEKISRFLKDFASKCLEASVMDVTLEQFKETEGGEYKKEDELSLEEVRRFEKFAEKLGYMKVGKGKEYKPVYGNPEEIPEVFGGTEKEDGFSSMIMSDTLEEQDGGIEIRRKPFNLDDL